MGDRSKASERTCCVCRSKGEKRALVRLVLCGGVLVADDNQRLPGRGAYIHPTLECLSRMGQPGRWERALRVVGSSIELSQVSRVARELMSRAGKNVE